MLHFVSQERMIYVPAENLNDGIAKVVYTSKKFYAILIFWTFITMILLKKFQIMSLNGAARDLQVMMKQTLEFRFLTIDIDFFESVLSTVRCAGKAATGSC